MTTLNHGQWTIFKGVQIFMLVIALVFSVLTLVTGVETTQVEIETIKAKELQAEPRQDLPKQDGSTQENFTPITENH